MTAEAYHVSKLTVSWICRESRKEKEESTEKVFLLPRKYINNLNRVINLENFQKDVLHGTVFEYYDSGEFPAAKM
jgi:hypothetical protein